MLLPLGSRCWYCVLCACIVRDGRLTARAARRGIFALLHVIADMGRWKIVTKKGGQKWRETPKRLRHGGKKVEIGQTGIFPELQIGQKA